MINNLLNDPNYTAEQKVQLMQLMQENGSIPWEFVTPQSPDMERSRTKDSIGYW